MYISVQPHAPFALWCQTVFNTTVGNGKVKRTRSETTDGIGLEGEHDAVLRESRCWQSELARPVPFPIPNGHTVHDVGLPFLILVRLLSFFLQDGQDFFHAFRLEEVVAINLLLMHVVI